MPVKHKGEMYFAIIEAALLTDTERRVMGVWVGRGKVRKKNVPKPVSMIPADEVARLLEEAGNTTGAQAIRDFAAGKIAELPPELAAKLGRRGSGRPPAEDDK